MYTNLKLKIKTSNFKILVYTKITIFLNILSLDCYSPWITIVLKMEYSVKFTLNFRRFQNLSEAFFSLRLTRTIEIINKLPLQCTNYIFMIFNFNFNFNIRSIIHIFLYNTTSIVGKEATILSVKLHTEISYIAPL